MVWSGSAVAVGGLSPPPAACFGSLASQSPPPSMAADSLFECSLEKVVLQARLLYAYNAFSINVSMKSI